MGAVIVKSQLLDRFKSPPLYNALSAIVSKSPTPAPHIVTFLAF